MTLAEVNQLASPGASAKLYFKQNGNVANGRAVLQMK